MIIYGRECKIQEVAQNEYKEFLNTNHIQKYAAAQKVYGLFYKKQLVQLMSFGRPRFNKNYQWEIIRECTKKNYRVIGGTSKLWKYFLANNSCRSCICYSYPHNGKFTSHYVKYCNFKNIKKSKPEEKVYFEGEWEGKIKRIDKSILEKHGVDRLLKTNQGHTRTNEQILLDLGFKKKIEAGYSPQVDIYYPFGLLYKITDLNDGSFYIGMTENKKEWESNQYFGSGKHWLAHIKRYPDIAKHPNKKNAHKYVVKILNDNFSTPKELRDAELVEIKKYVIKKHGKKIIEGAPGLMNLELRTQGMQYSGFIKESCKECGGKGNHKKTCSQYKKPAPCPECGKIKGHTKYCSHYIKPTPCKECGGIYGHRKTCSYYKPSKPCSECGATQGSHKKHCSRYQPPVPCNECGAIKGHKKGCSKYKRKVCPECGVSSGHLKTCSRYVERGVCSECGGKQGTHKEACSKYRKKAIICKECGGKQGKHKKVCSLYKKRKNSLPCPECGAIVGHKKECSKFVSSIVCSECGGKRGQHFRTCSKVRVCSECGSTTTHKRWCSKYVEPKVCEECGGRFNNHKKTCSKYVPHICPECGAGNNAHKKTCSKYKPPKNSCPYCNTPPGGFHKKNCPNRIM